jgi:hypothetical protein
MTGGMVMQALAQTDHREGARAKEAVPFGVVIYQRSTLVGTIDGIPILKGALPLTLGKSPLPQRFSRTTKARTLRADHAFHVNKIPIVAVAEGCGAQDMVTLVPRR